MTGKRADLEFLIPDLGRWNDGAGIDVGGWIECVGSYELAVGYSLIFWPEFTRSEEYVLRAGFSEESLRGFEQQAGFDRASIEAVMNHIHLADLHCNAACSEAQLRHLGRILQDVHATKLRRDFPGVNFVIWFNDEPDLALTDYQLTFWQQA